MTDDIMTCTECDELFGDYFEGDLGGALRKAFTDHVAQCARCQGIVSDVESIRDQASAMPALSPSRDLWSGIEERIEPRVVSIAERTRAPVSRRWPAVAAAALVVATSGVTYVATRQSFEQRAGVNGGAVRMTPQLAVASPPPAAGITAGASSVIPLATPDRVAETTASSRGSSLPAQYRASRASFAASRPPVTASELAFAGEIAQLQHVLVVRRSQLDPETVKVVEDNLAVIDIAVSRARAALANDPASGFLTRQLDAALQKKIELLRTVALLPAST